MPNATWPKTKIGSQAMSVWVDVIAGRARKCSKEERERGIKRGRVREVREVERNLQCESGHKRQVEPL